MSLNKCILTCASRAQVRQTHIYLVVHIFVKLKQLSIFMADFLLDNYLRFKTNALRLKLKLKNTKKHIKCVRTLIPKSKRGSNI